MEKEAKNVTIKECLAKELKELKFSREEIPRVIQRFLRDHIWVLEENIHLTDHINDTMEGLHSRLVAALKESAMNYRKRNPIRK